jgi:hypothetical protein
MNMETKKKNLLSDIEHIVALAGKHKLKNLFFEKAQPYLQSVAAVLRITETQAAFLSLVLEKSDEGAISVGSIAKAVECSRIQILKYMDDFEALEKKHLIVAEASDRFSHSRGRAGSLPSYFVPVDVIKAIRAGRSYRGNEYRGLDPEGFFSAAQELLEARRENHLSDQLFASEIKSLCAANAASAFVKTIKETALCFRASVHLLAFCCAWIDETDENLPFRALRPLLRTGEIAQLQHTFCQGKHELITNGILSYGNDDGLADTATWTLTQKAKDTFLAELDIKKKTQNVGGFLIPADTISERTLYYNTKTAIRIGELTRLLQHDAFTSITQRLTEQHMGAAFTILFQGPPGTGKTETVNQIARLTGRDICLVDISETKSQWFGESEKRIKAVFSRYKAMVRRGGITPILLFNEADAVLGKRQELTDIRRGPAQTENAIQNIILQEMETLHGGILIATTNMIANLDKAFERRFLYKIEFEKPDIKVKAQIWQSRLTGLEAEDAQTLSRRYDFSGGQIDNIVRKQTINSILSGSPLDLGGLAALCEDELLDKAAKPIGFHTNEK